MCYLCGALARIRRIRTALIVATLSWCGAASPAWSQSAPPCTGDCSGGNTVTVDEILLATAIGLGDRSLTQCPAADRSGDRVVTVDEILVAIENALNGCPRPPGIVAIVNRHSRKCLEVVDGSQVAGANVQQSACIDHPRQRWSFIAIDDDHMIVNQASGQCLEIAGGSVLDKGNARQGICQALPEQRWQVLHYGDPYLLSATHSAKCLDIEGSSVADGANAIQFECRGSNNQLWIIPEEALRFAE